MADVRQGGVLSLLLYAVFIDSVVCKLRAVGFGAYIGNHYFGCLLYADDMLLVAHSVCDMQLKSDICSLEAECLDFTFNTDKSVELRVGSNYKRKCAPLILSGMPLVYVDQIKYLGIMLTSARSFRCLFGHVKIKFYRSLTLLFIEQERNASSELVCVHLVRSICLPILFYA